jgi:hypothetical protein
MLLTATSLPAAEPRVVLEVAVDRGFPATDAGAWSELLTKAGFSNVRIRSGQGGEEPSLERRSGGTGAAFHVVGLLTANNQLVLPNARFGIRDRTGIEQWLAKVRLDGAEGISIKAGAFGLLPRHLETVREALATPVKFSTAGKSPREVAKGIADGLSLKFVTDPAGQRALAAMDPVADELAGLSSGTALAAVLRPLGLALVPERAGAELRLRIADGRTVKEYWPVGWPPKGNPRETLPDLFKFLTVEITQTPAAEAISAIGERLKAPVLIDHNSLAKFEVDLNAKIDLPSAKTFYAAVLDRTLFQAKLKYELRVDEADKPFLWITTLRQ